VLVDFLAHLDPASQPGPASAPPPEPQPAAEPSSAEIVTKVTRTTRPSKKRIDKMRQV
jgi:hypothetical protein